MAATAPTFAAHGTASFCAPAKIKVLLVPASPLENAEFEKWASFVRNFDCLRLRDVPRAKSNVFPSSPLYQQGEVHISFATTYDPAHAYLAPLQLHEQVLGVLGLTTYDARTPACSQELPHVAGHLRSAHPNALVHRVFAFDVDPNDEDARAAAGDGDLGVTAEEPASDFQPPSTHAPGFSGRRDGGLFVFPAVRRDAKDVRFYLRTQLAEFVGALLDQLDTLVGALEGTPLETPRETLTDTVSPAIRAAMNKSATNVWGRGHTPLDAPPLPPRHAQAVFGALSKRRTSATPTPAALPATGPLGSARHTKVRGDLALLSGDLWGALELYDSLLTVSNRERAMAGGQDAVWFASALEGWAVARMLVARLGGAAHSEAPCLAFTLHQAKDKDKDKDKEVREPVIPALAWKDIAEAYALALTVYAKCLAPPQVQLEALRSVTSDTPRDYTPPLVHVSACLAYARFLLAVWASGGWNGEAFDQMLFGGTPPALVAGSARHTELSANSGVYRDEIARAACTSLTPALRTLPATDQIATLGAVAKLLGLVGYRRRLAHVVRLLDGVVSTLLARSFRARAQAPGRAPSLETLLHEALRLRVATTDTHLDVGYECAGMHDTANPALLLGLLACDTYGIDLLTCPLLHVPSTHILERARRRVVAEQYGPLLESVVGADAPAARTLLPAFAQSAEAARIAKPPFGWTSLQVQLLKDLVVQSEALADYVSMAFFATLLLRDFQTVLGAEEHVALLDGLRRVLPRARASAPGLALRYWGPRQLLVALEVAPLPAHRRTNPFFWNTARTAKPADTPTLVAGEPCEVQVTLRNPLGVPLRIEELALHCTGVDAATPATRTLVPPHAVQTLPLQVTPRAAGRLAIEGCTVTLWGATPEVHRIARAAPVGVAPPASKAAGLDARPTVAALTRGTDVDAALAPPAAPPPAACDVTPALPLLHASLPTLGRTALTLLEGEVATLPLTLTNTSDETIAFVRFELDDALQAPMRAAIADGKLLAGDVHELEWQLLYQPVLAIGSDARTLELAPRASCTVPLRVRAKAECAWASVRVYYGNPAGEDAALVLRTTLLSIPLSVRPSVECLPLGFAAVDTHSAEHLAAQLMHAEAVTLGPSFLLRLDLRNVSERWLDVVVDAQAAPDVALHMERSVLPHTTVRIHVPMAKQTLTTAALQAPIPKLSPRQFVVAKSPLSDEMQAACNAQFWLRHALLESVRIAWREPHTALTGDVSLRSQWPSIDDVRIFSQPKVRIDLHLAEPTVAREALVEVVATLTNRTEAPLQLRLHLAPTAGARLEEERAEAFAAAQVLFADGSDSAAVHPSPLAPNAVAEVRKTLCFLSSGTFALHATAQVIPDTPDVPATVFVSTPLPLHVS
ncbi:TRS120 [Malassezia furfur]|nr:TRS120 [Malassezia furfur]